MSSSFSPLLLVLAGHAKEIKSYAVSFASTLNGCTHLTNTTNSSCECKVYSKIFLMLCTQCWHKSDAQWNIWNEYGKTTLNQRGKVFINISHCLQSLLIHQFLFPLVRRLTVSTDFYGRRGSRVAGGGEQGH